MTDDNGRTRDWQGIISPEPPSRAWHLAAILDQAEQMLASRKRALPQMAHRGKISWNEANSQIALFEFIVADWRWLVLGEGEPAHALSRQDRKDALDKSIATIAEIAADKGGFDDELDAQAQLVIAMRWWLDDPLFPHADMPRLARMQISRNLPKGQNLTTGALHHATEKHAA